MDERYHLNRPLIFTTNVEEKAWAEYLGDPVSTRAILDRIFHHAVKIEIRGPSYRQHQGMELQKKYEKHKWAFTFNPHLIIANHDEKQSQAVSHDGLFFWLSP